MAGRSAPPSPRAALARATRYYAEMPQDLHIMLVQVHVLPDCIDAFRQATCVNAEASLRESGVARFDVLQDREDPARFLLVEVYRSAEAPAAHKETEHYRTWRDTVAPMMAEPRTSRKLVNVFPDNAGW